MANDRDAAWQAYRDEIGKLGNLTQREENAIRSAFRAGWSARDAPPQSGQTEREPDPQPKCDCAAWPFCGCGVMTRTPATPPQSGQTTRHPPTTAQRRCTNVQ